MEILQVCAYAAPYPGNFIASLTQLEIKLNQQGYKVIYAFPETAQDKEWCLEISKRTKVYFLPVAKARILPCTYKIFRKIYQENNIRIMHSHFELYDIPATITSPKSTKIFWHLHDALEEIFRKSNLLTKILWKLQYSVFSKRAILLSVSEKHKQFAIQLGFSIKSAKYLPNGLNTKRIRTFQMQKRELDFLMFGWEFHIKGVDLALKAASLLEHQKFKLMVVGGEATWDLIDKSQFKDSPFLIKQNPVEDVNQLYNNSKCFLHISRAEGFSYALLEAVYSGLPVICSDIKENSFAKEFPQVVFVKSENIEEINIAMKNIINNKYTFSNEDIKRSREIIGKKYSHNAWADTLLSYYSL